MAQREPLHNNIIVLLICMLLGGCTSNNSQTIVATNLYLNSSDQRLSNRNGTIYFLETPYTGNLFTLYETRGDTAAIARYVEGKENGEWKKYYSGQKLQEIRVYTMGKKTGVLQSWWPNGQKQFFYQFKDDEYEGNCYEWNERGGLTRVMHYKAGHEEGVQKIWYENGKIKANYIIQSGRRYGLLGTKNCVNVSDSIFKN